jgi:hypothetical protein
MRLPFSPFVLLALTACGGSPPPAPAPTGPSTWAAVAPPAGNPPKLSAAKVYQVAHTGALPGVDALESTLAKLGLVADVGDEAEGRVIESQGVRCSVQPTPKLGDDVLPSPKIEPEYARWGLTMAEAEQLAASTTTAEISCKPSTSALLGAQVAIQVTGAVASLTKGLVRDPAMGKWFAPAAWAPLWVEKHFAVTEHVRVDTTGDGPLRALQTHGLRSFGRTELAIYPVAEADAQALAARLMVLADSVLLEDAPAPGAASSLGPAKFVYLPPDVYDAHAPAGPRPPSTQDTLVLADPKGALKSQAAVDALVRRLTAE